MSASRDKINWVGDLRVDAGDMVASEQNARSDLRSQFNAFLFGLNESGKQRVFGGFTITANSPADSLFDITNGTAFGSEIHADSTQELGVIFGNDGDATKAVDMTGQPAAVYNVYIRFSHDTGETQVRVFYNPDTELEEADSIDTRIVFDWDVTVGTVSPGDEWLKVGEIDWDGSTVQTADITHTRNMFFEGDEDASFAQEWGDGGNDRNTARGTYGIKTLNRWIEAVRRQLADIIGATATGWYAAIPTSLTTAAAHIADASDPHGATLTQTTLDVGELADIENTILTVSPGGAPPTMRGHIDAADIFAGHDDQQVAAENYLQLINWPVVGHSGKVACASAALANGALTSKSWIPLRIEGAPAATGTPTLTYLAIGWYNYHNTTSNSVEVVVEQVTPLTGAVTDVYTQTLAPVATGAGSTLYLPALAIDTANYYYRLRLTFTHAGDNGANNGLGIYHIEYRYQRSELFDWQ
jgi:hypothetical protein